MRLRVAFLTANLTATPTHLSGQRRLSKDMAEEPGSDAERKDPAGERKFGSLLSSSFLKVYALDAGPIFC